jgi:glycosyltransferase involved in cell wall biosynthesis
MPKRLGIGWQVGVPSGWGTYGVNLAVQLARKAVTPVLPFLEEGADLTPEQAAILAGPIKDHPRWADLASRPAAFDFPLLYALGDVLELPNRLVQLKGTPDIGVVFFESATIPAANLKAAERFALIVTGSTWNAEVLKRHGFSRVANCPQGVDLAMFKPGPRAGTYAGRFAVFSGGKLEYRKGQDLVVAAFKRFRARCPEALLVTAWHNPWAAAAASLGKSPHVAGAPPVKDGRLDVAGWLRLNGLPDEAFVDLGALPNIATPAVLREMDIAVLPSRCEGGTNLVAMECMACGVPVVLSRNTGHLDLIAGDNCYTIDMQIPIGQVTGRADLDGWGESSIDELVRRMQEAHDDPAGARTRGAAGAKFMQDWDWSAQIDRLLTALAPYL